MSYLETKIRSAWIGRVSGCQLGKPVERMSIREGHSVLASYLSDVGSLPLRDYVKYKEGSGVQRECCRDFITRSEPDDDINYTFLALLMLEKHGRNLSTNDVARAWLKQLPAAQTYTAERSAYKVLMEKGDEWFAETGKAGFDLRISSDNPYNDWIGAQIRADLYGWVCPGKPDLAARLVTEDANLSHRGDGVHGAVFVAVLGALLMDSSPEQALAKAKDYLPKKSGVEKAVLCGESLIANPNGGAKIRDHYSKMSPVHSLNNLAIVVWALFSNLSDYSAAIGEAVAAGLDTDCNGATVGGLWGLQSEEIPDRWLSAWQGTVGVSLAGYNEVSLDDLVDRTVALAKRL